MKSSPTIRLLLGLLVTLGAVTGFSSYALYQLTRLQDLQNQTIDRNRHDSLLLLRIQNDVNMVGLKLRDMTQSSHPVGIYTYRDQFAGLKADLTDALHSERNLSRSARPIHPRDDLMPSLDQFWRTSDAVFEEAGQGHEAAARELVARQLSRQQTDLANSVSNLLVRNTTEEASADKKIGQIYRGVTRDIYAFLAGTIFAIAVTSLYLIYSNRKIFEKLESLSKQRRVLAAKLITVQEEVLRSVSRELHDEFGQILTAVGAMLARAERKGLPADSPLRTELTEVREITHSTLEKMRSLSQMLHPTVLDDYGLAKGIEWYAGVFQRQNGIQTDVYIAGEPVRITGQPAIHCFRIVQEALTNATKHSGSKRAEVRLDFSPRTLTLSVTDFGRGMATPKRGDKPGLGLVAMRERAELLDAKLNISSEPGLGTTVSVQMPYKHEEAFIDDLQPELTEEEVVSRTL
ncbi:MAG: sensor histidine kinase [Acidobacteriaceae bacterium]|nr:sensor histidine kinase [Acidobacteriaceae bacterium]